MLRRSIRMASKRFYSIYALSSGGLPAALAVVRITGKESEQALSRLTGKTTNFESHKLFYTPIYDERRQIIDRAMAVFLRGPKTFTGEDMAELYLHGSRAVVDIVLSTLSRFPKLEPAKAGEFTKRAFFNSKLDAAQLEALGDLLMAETPAQLRLAHQQQEAAKRLKPFQSRLIKLIAQLEATIDFSEDLESQQNPNWRREFREAVQDSSEQLRKLTDLTRTGMLIRNGVQVVLIGRTNVGKSSLMNRLASRDVAIVSKIPGTTRDSLEIRTSLANLPITVVDTAGFRPVKDELENEGIRRSVKKSSEAHIAVLVLSADRLLTSGCSINEEVDYLKRVGQVPQHVEQLICVNKADLLSEQQRSRLTKDELSRRISAISNDNQELFLSRERHLHLLCESISSLDAFQESFGEDSALAAQHLRNAAESIGEIAGTVVNERILDELFSQFCIGK